MFSGKTLSLTGGTGSLGNAVPRQFLPTEIGEIRANSDGYTSASSVVGAVPGRRLRVAILTGPALCGRHGSGAQILRVFREAEVDFWHLYWLGTAGYVSDHPDSALLNTLPRLKRLRGGRVLDIMEGRLGLAWWDGDQVSRRKLTRLLASRGWLCDVAYVCVASESEARRARSILNILACPYVVHLMDLCHDNGIDPESMPGYRDLLSGASTVMALSEPIAEEVRKLRPDGAILVRFGQTRTRVAAEPPGAAGKFRIVMSGSLGGGSNDAPLHLLAEAWPAALERVPGLELVYCGHRVEQLGEAVRAFTTCTGLIRDPEIYASTLAGCHMAYLPTCHQLDCFGRYSVPSKLGDYLMAGLPVLANVACGSASERFLASLAPKAVRYARTVADFVSGVLHFRGLEAWHEGHRLARRYAEQHLDIQRVREGIMVALAEANTDQRRPFHATPCP